MQERAREIITEMLDQIPPMIKMVINPFLMQYLPLFDEIEEDQISSFIKDIENKITYIKTGEIHED